MLRKLLIVVLLFCTLPLFGQESDYSETVALAGAAYDKLEFEKARDLYEKALGEGNINGHVFYNLGNTYYRIGNNGEAIAAWLSARRYLPRNPDVTANLTQSLNKIKDRLDSRKDRGVAGVVGFWIFRFSPAEFAGFAAWMSALLSLLVVVGVFVEKARVLKKIGLVLMVLPAFSFMSFVASVAVDDTWGAVTSEVAKVYSGPNEGNTALFELHEGAPFALTLPSGEWYKIELSDGKKGWISAVDVRVYID